ncbi:uncharacterized protein [Haliotis cracherodii]|uniref:uncharacterized protein n=1 Tax=Haliotis cracherodii TaxID=6455 RepID=UPI0039E9C988
MSSRRLKSNGDKTEALLAGTKHQLCSVAETTIAIGQSQIDFMDKVKSLGVIMDSNHNLDVQVNQLCGSFYFHSRCIGQIRTHITTEATKYLIQCLVPSSETMETACLWGVVKQTVDRLQLVQNTTARIVTRTSHTSHVTPVLKHLHWLPVESRIMYKMLSLIYKCVNKQAPPYLSTLRQLHNPPRTLQISTCYLFLSIDFPAMD